MTWRAVSVINHEVFKWPMWIDHSMCWKFNLLYERVLQTCLPPLFHYHCNFTLHPSLQMTVFFTLACFDPYHITPVSLRSAPHFRYFHLLPVCQQVGSSASAVHTHTSSIIYIIHVACRNTRLKNPHQSCIKTIRMNFKWGRVQLCITCPFF